MVRSPAGTLNEIVEPPLPTVGLEIVSGPPEDGVHVRTSLVRNAEPVSIRVKVVLPTGMLLGLNVVICGVEVRTKLAEFEVAWLTGSVTVMVAVPTLFRRVLDTVTGMDEVLLAPASANCVVLLAKVKFTTGEVGKLLPVSVRVRSLAGLMKVKVGFRVLIAGVGLMTKFRVFEVTPIDVLVTDTVAVPAVLNKLVGTVAVMRVDELFEIASDVVTPPNVQFTFVFRVGRFVPVKLRLTAFGCRATAEIGDKLVNSGPEPITKLCVAVGKEVEELMTPIWTVAETANRLAGIVAVS